jgi:drug/metabolite transporter (DMT)-like permease
MAVTCSLLWGLLAIVMKVVSEEVDSITIVWFRFTLAFSLLGVILSCRDRRRLGILLRPPLLGLLAALALCANYIGYMQGLALTTPSFAQILIQLAPLLLAMVGVVWFKERLNRAQFVGVGLTVIGFILFYHDQFQAQVVAGNVLREGLGYLVFASIFWAAYASLQKHLVQRGCAPQDLNLLLYALPIPLLFYWADFRLLAELSAAQWLLMIFLGANTLLAYGALGEALKRLPAYQVSLIITLNPLITLVVMAGLRGLSVSWVPDDEVSWLGYSAALLVVLGITQVLIRTDGCTDQAS